MGCIFLGGIAMSIVVENLTVSYQRRPVVHHVDMVFEDGKMFDGSSVEGWKTINKADMLLMPIAETAVVDPFAQIPTLSISL